MVAGEAANRFPIGRLRRRSRRAVTVAPVNESIEFGSWFGLRKSL